MITHLLIAMAPCSATQDLPDEPQHLYPPLVLPHVLTGEADAHHPARPTVNIWVDGRVQVDDVIYLDQTWKGADATRAWGKLTQEFTRLTRSGPRERLDPRDPASDLVPTTPLLIRADLNSPFSMTLGVLRCCGSGDLRLRHIHFAVGDARSPALDPAIGLVPQTVPQQRIPWQMPADSEPSGDGGPRSGAALRVRVRVIEGGTRLEVDRTKDEPWDGVGRFRFDLSSRRVEYSTGDAKVEGFLAFRKLLQGMGPQLRGRQAVLDIGPGATAGEALVLMDALRDLAVAELNFALSSQKD